MSIDISHIIWIFFMIAALQPLFRKRLLQAIRQRCIVKLEKMRNSRVILLVHRQESMNLLGFPILRYH